LVGIQSRRIVLLFLVIVILVYSTALVSGVFGYETVQNIDARIACTGFSSIGNTYTYTTPFGTLTNPLTCINTLSCPIYNPGCAWVAPYFRDSAAIKSLPLQNVYGCKIVITGNSGNENWPAVGTIYELNSATSYSSHFLIQGVHQFDTNLIVPNPGSKPFIINGISYALSGSVPLQWQLQCEICEPQYYLEGSGCCKPGNQATFNTLGPECCVNGNIIQSDTQIPGTEYVCYNGGLYSLVNQAADSPYTKIDNGCQLREQGSRYYYDEAVMPLVWRSEADDSQAHCEKCNGPNAAKNFEWNDQANQCCGDDGKDDEGSAILDNTNMCYNGEWLDAYQDTALFFKIKTVDDTRNSINFRYDVISNSDKWYTCDANGLVLNTKNTLQLPEGGKLGIPEQRTVTESVQNLPTEVQEQITSDSVDFDTFLTSGVGVATATPTPQTVAPSTTPVTYADNAPKFICARESNDNKFLECCSSGQCVNNDESRIRGRGAFINTIKEFSRECDKQYCPYGWGLETTKTEYSLGVFLNGKSNPSNFLADANLSDWTNYDSLDFYAYAVDDLNLDVVVGTDFVSGNGLSLGDYTQYIFANVLKSDYAINGGGLKKWIHIQLPIPTQLKNKKINVVGFKVNKDATRSEGTIFSLGSKNYYNLIFLDKIHLVKNTLDFVCADNSWEQDLDNSQSACNSVPSYAWTGSRCCGDDLHEYYQDSQDMDNYCWNGNILRPGTAVAEAEGWNSPDADLLYGADRQFYSCSDRDEVSYDDLTVQPNVQISNQPQCLYINEFVCSPNNKWSKNLYGLNEIQDRDTIKPDSDGVEEVCCAKNQCWTGLRCLDAVSGITENTPLQNPELLAGGVWGDEELSACVLDSQGYGQWLDVSLATDWDQTSEAYCPGTDTCWDGRRCVFEGKYSEDHYCSQGVWSTRTKLLAKKMLQWADDFNLPEFSLYCDWINNTLPYTGYEPVNTFLANKGANNFCVLKYGDNVVVGTTLNEDKLPEFLGIVNKDCDFGENLGDAYTMCNGNDPQVWYNPVYDTVIYSNSNVYYFGDTSSSQAFDIWLKSPIDSTISTILNVIRPVLQFVTGRPIVDSSYLTSPGDFNRFYFGLKDDKKVVGIIEKKLEKSYLLVDYTGFRTDVCRYMNKPQVFCQPIIDTAADTGYADYNLFSFDKNKFDEIWQSATSMLRLQSHVFGTLFGGASAVIESPVAGAVLTPSLSVKLTAANPQEDVTYYWDLNSVEILNGERKGADLIVPVTQEAFPRVGNYKITLIALSKYGKYGLADVTVARS
jgi:hypothetical protein